MASNHVTVIVQVQSLLCRTPFHGAGTMIGVVVPKDANVDPGAFEVLDADSGGFTVPELRPNFVVSRTTFDEEDGLVFNGWVVENRDENLERLLRAQFSWTGPSIPPIVVQAQVSTFFNCSPIPGVPNPQLGHTSSAIELGVLVPPEMRIGRISYQIRGDTLPWVQQLDGALVQIASQGLPVPHTPGVQKWSVNFTNSHTVFARMCRVIVNRETRD